jgi:hypothetical protein
MNQQLIAFLKGRVYLISIFIMISFICQAQRDQRPGFDIMLGYGAAGSFFVRSYDETVMYAEDKKLYRKNFAGSNRCLDIGLHFKKGYSLRLGYSRQHFTKEVDFKGFFDQWQIEVDRKIYHIDNIFSLSLDKRLFIQNMKGSASRHVLIPALGAYYLRSIQNEIDILFSLKAYDDTERNYKNSKLEEAGLFIATGYEYLLQPKVGIGMNARFNYTISTGDPESISLTPYVRFIF